MRLTGALVLIGVSFVMSSSPPVAKVRPKKTRLHGKTLVDPYAWLREKTNPEVIAYLEAENRYTEAVMKDTEGLQAKLYAEMVGRIQETDQSVPVRRGDYYYYTRTEQGKQYPIYCRKRGSLEAAEEILLDGNELGAGAKYFRVGVFEPSPDHKLLAFSTDREGDEEYVLEVKNLETGQLLADRIPRTYYSVEWAADNRTLFYNVLDAAKRPYQVLRHRLGEKPEADVVVYQEPDERFTVDVGKTRSGKYLVLHIASSVTSEARYLDAAAPEGEFRVLAPRRQDIEYSIDQHSDWFYVLINDTGRNFRLVRAPVTDPSPGKWQELRAHRADTLLESVDLFARHLVVTLRRGGVRQLEITNLETEQTHAVGFPEAAYSVTVGDNSEFDTALLRFTYQSLVTPPSVFDYHMEERTRELKKQEPVLGGYDTSQYVTERLEATAPDGVKVPVVVVYRKGLKKDGENPALLYGYGSYGINTEPYFASRRLSLLDRGFIFAMAQIRGGAEMGRPWHDDGKMLNKKNTFTDFIACAEHLIALGYTKPSRLAIEGGSAGGLLMGAVVTKRPELFHAVLAHVPFVDVINTMLDTSLPLTVGEFEEWGNPRERRYFDYMLSYSPYENTKPAAYPHMLITAGLNDPRVSYWEPAKWTAKLRAVKKDQNLLLLKTNMGAGHFGASGRYDRLKEIAFEYAFLLKVMGIRE
jgi:oligopeptidase B